MFFSCREHARKSEMNLDENFSAEPFRCRNTHNSGDPQGVTLPVALKGKDTGDKRMYLCLILTLSTIENEPFS